MDDATLFRLWEYARALNFVRCIVVDGEELVGSTDFVTIHDEGATATDLGLDSEIFANLTPDDLFRNTKLLFYSSESEAREAGHPDDVILVWPHEGAIEGISNAIYLGTLRSKSYAMRFAETGLSLPLTIDDFVNEEEKIKYPIWAVPPRTLLYASFEASKRGALAFTEEIAIFHFAGTPELDVQVREYLEQLELDFIEDFLKIERIFESAGTPEVFLAVAKRAEDEGLTVEQIIALLEAG